MENTNDQMIRDDGQMTARFDATEIGDAAYEYGSNLGGNDVGVSEKLGPYSYWSDCVDVLGLAEAVRCARQGWSDAETRHDEAQR